MTCPPAPLMRADAAFFPVTLDPPLPSILSEVTVRPGHFSSAPPIVLRTVCVRQPVASTIKVPDPADHITRQTAVQPSDQADCPRWLAFLDEATVEDPEMIRFLQKWCSYFTASRNDRHPADLAKLRGARMISASETEEGCAWAESRIKQLTGGDKISARFMRQDFFTYEPQFKLLIVGNHRPVLNNVDDVARRRFNVAPFVNKLAHPNRTLEATLRAEWPGILRWMVDRCIDWQAHGLMRPSRVVEATESYFDDQDFFGQWLKDDCLVDKSDLSRWELSAELFARYRQYAEAAGEDPGSHPAVQAGDAASWV